MEGLFTVIPVNGDVCNIGDGCTDALRYDNLTWDEVIELSRLSFLQEFEVIIWKIASDTEAQTDE